MKAIVFDLGITVKDVIEQPINKDFVMVTPSTVLFTGLENAIYTGFLWVEPKRILGSTGIVKIRNVGIEVDKNIEGKNAVVLPYSKKYGGIGTEIDGILSEYAVIPEDSIVVLPDNFNIKYVLYPFVSIGLQLRKIVKGFNVLIVGGGLVSYISSLALVGYASRVYLYNDEGYKVRLYGVEEIKDGGSWDIIFAGSMRSWIRVALQFSSKEGDILALPKFLNSWPAIIPTRLNVRLIEPMKMDGVFEFIDDEITDKIFQELVVSSDSLESSIPTPKPGVLFNAEKFFSARRS
ncbi:zinc-binding alcohol dehydrogenase family protein [Stygiolobus caldivivus]|uniref:Alcohol dehydrogenase n=1 Tax=Stygiolobus caldivivus TaxID=2824673 RepID=A0A8D5U8R5_9CREN|nr:zinc-binding alcohol dehydrogenase family protein [Stygiolobus caldivivus]BCU71307.1 alcohol dehydrogenase [Stygiolobus caldivivus]